MKNSYEAWILLSDTKRRLHKEITDRGLWGEPSARDAYYDLERRSESAWVEYQAQKTGKSTSEVTAQMNSVYHSRFD